jgi:4-coumarate--CoA ligase
MMPKLVCIFRMRIVDPETNDIKDAGETGEIQVLGEGVMIGYLDNPKANQETFTPDGWLQTGDIGYYDDEGLLYISDRMKELIKVKSSTTTKIGY